MLLMLLSCFVALGPLSTDMYLPAFPAIAEAFASDSAATQLTLSSYLAGFCLFHLICGPLSDRYGRKPILLLGMLIFLLTSIACALASSMEQLVVWRFMQGVGACSGATVARAMVRDMYGPLKAVKAFANMAAIMALAPVIAPIIGGWMLGFLPWPSIFWFLAIYSVYCMVMLLWRVPESLPQKQSILFSAVFRNYCQLLTDRRYLLSVMSASFLFAGTFAFVSSSSFILIEFMKVPVDQFGYWFMFIVGGYIVGSVFVGRYGQRIKDQQLIMCGLLLAVAAGLVMTLLCYWQVYYPLAIVLPLALYTAAMGTVLPQAMATAMAAFSHIAGTASALMGFLQMGVASLATVVTSIVLVSDPMPLALTIVGCSCGALILFLPLLGKNGNISH